MGRARRLIATAALAAALPGAVAAACATASTGARCVVPGARADAAGVAPGRWIAARPAAPRFAPGDVLPAGRYFRLLNTGYYGLPPVDGDWRYYEVEGRVLRVRPDTLEVIGDATAEANRAF